jgi:hypothetical protein
MKIRRAGTNIRRKVVEASVGRRRLVYPFARRLEPRPSANDPIVDIRVDREIASEGFIYTLASRRRGTVHVEQVLEYNKRPWAAPGSAAVHAYPGGAGATGKDLVVTAGAHPPPSDFASAVLPPARPDELSQIS